MLSCIVHTNLSIYGKKKIILCTKLSMLNSRCKNCLCCRAPCAQLRCFKKIIKLKFSSKNLSSLIFICARSHMHKRMADMLHVFGLRGCKTCFKVCQRWFVVHVDVLLAVLSKWLLPKVLIYFLTLRMSMYVCMYGLNV